MSSPANFIFLPSGDWPGNKNKRAIIPALEKNYSRNASVVRIVKESNKGLYRKFGMASIGN